MAQENANILHAAIHIRGSAVADPATDPPEILALTGIEAAAVVLRQDLAAIAPSVIQVDLVAGIDDSELVCAAALGTLDGPTFEGAPPVLAGTPSTVPLNVERPPLAFDSGPENTEKRRFWIALPGGVGTIHVSWWRVPLLDAPIPTQFVAAPPPPPP